jgi:GT2 family glycosyltransferase
VTGSTVVEPAGPGPRRPGRPVTAPVPQVRPRHPPAAERSATGRGDPGGTALLDVPDADAVPVLAVLVAHDGAAWLPRALAAVARSTRRPDVLVAVDTGSVDGSRDLLAAAGQVAGVVSLPRTASPGEAVAAGVALAREALAASWVPPTGRRARAAEPLVWILHDDCAPAPEALEMLLGAVVAAPTVAVAGCKLVGWDDPGELVEVGVTVSPTGRRMTGLAPGERDQGQHDSRSDVLAVSTAGALVRWDVVESVGAFDPAIPLAGDDIDLCRRVRAAGHRVVVVPSARCRHAAALETGVRAGDALLGPRAARRRRGPAGPRLRGHRRRHALYSRVVAAGPWRVLPTLAWLFLEVLGHAAFLLADRRPLAAAGEVAAWWSVASTPWRVAAGWRRAGPTRASGRAAVRRLQPSAVRLAVDRLDQAVGEAARRAVTARPHPVLLVTAAVAVVAAVPARLQVPAAAGAGTDAGIRTVAAAGLTAGELWRRTAAGAVPPDPATAVWAVLSGAAALVTGRAPQDGTLAAAAAWVGWAAVPLAVLTAWALVREVSAGRRAGPLLAVAWAAVPGLAAAAGVGYAATTDERLVHALAPLPVWALAVVLRRRAVPWLGAGVAVGGVAAVVVVALQPAAWPLLVAAGLGTAAAVLGRRVGPARSWRLLAVATVSAAPSVAFPAWAVTAWSSPLVVLLAPAHRDGAPVLQAWREGAWVADDAASGVALAGLAVVAAAGLAGAGLGVLRAPVARTAVAAAVALASWAVVAGAVTADLPGGRTRALDPVWAAPLLAVLVAAAAGATRRRARPTGRRLAAVVAAVVAAGAVGWAAVGVVVTVPAAAGLPVPAAVDAASPAGLATLTLTVSAPADTGPTVTWALDRGQPGPGTDATAAQVAGPPPAAVEDLVTDLLGGAPAADAAADGGTSVDGRRGRVGVPVRSRP